ncbi:MAG: hypothetical protein CFE23_03240 [Flavobacterium sp. BFFFF1]|uniref:DUF4268 domain-containing protein n=1 Tax=Flavobacterium sp. BFFFF1 TaxID=2015557 RepID=UPI000BCF4DF3|nr:DUF4268 domain-containing protein [Flavobacterium sp. BFFFF1]OYU81902.1 MAG: hypothetical protein CFE23_03240 [Flavobacterium sp. BFFFF1]
MYSKEETQRLKREFWIAFAEKYPRKWMLYDTKIKDAAFKFYADNKKAQVIMEIEPRSDHKRFQYFEKMESLKNILREEHIKDLVFERHFILENGKKVSRIWVEKTGLSMNNRQHWDAVFEFFNDHMDAFERFFYEYSDYIMDIDLNE